MRSRNAATWLRMVSSSAWRCELTRAYKATLKIPSIRSRPPGNAGCLGEPLGRLVQHGGFVVLQHLAYQRPNLLVRLRPHLIFEPMGLGRAAEPPPHLAAFTVHGEISTKSF